MIKGKNGAKRFYAKRSHLLAASRQPHAALQVRRVGEVIEERKLPHGVSVLKARGAQVLAERRRVAADVEHLVAGLQLGCMVAAGLQGCRSQGCS